MPEEMGGRGQRLGEERCYFRHEGLKREVKGPNKLHYYEVLYVWGLTSFMHSAASEEF